MTTTELTCIGCPLGCLITVTTDGNKITEVKGNTCPKGEAYARKEVTSPSRIVTSTVTVTGGVRATASVKTSSDIPKGKIQSCIAALRDVSVAAPVRAGDVIVHDVAGCGADVVATGSVSAA